MGCIRKLRLGHTLKKKEGGGWKMDLTKARDGHKTSRFYGPFAASLPEELTPILDKYCAVLEFDDVGESGPYLFHPPQGSTDRAMESSAWSQWVSRLFQRHAGIAIAPKTLRSIFITWLRDNTADGSILKSAAHAMKHSEARQASADYDQVRKHTHKAPLTSCPASLSSSCTATFNAAQESDDRLVKAAYEFNLQFAAGFQASASGGADSSTAAAGSGSGQADGEDGGDNEGGEGGGEGGGESVGLVDDEWKRLPGGPFTARLMTKSKQPVATASYRNYGVAVPIDPINGPLYPGCEIKFPVVAGGPPEGIICSLPRSWGAGLKMLIFKLKLSRAGATEGTATIASALYREPRVDTDENEEEAAAAVDLMAHEQPVHPSPVHPAEGEQEGEEAEEAAGDGDAEEMAEAEAAEGEAVEEAADEARGEGGDDDDDSLPSWVLGHGGGGAAANPPTALADNEEVAALLPPPPPPPPVVPRSSSRLPKRKERFGENGELEGAASRFRSAPPSRKASIDPSVEMGVPAYALPGEQVWAMGLHAGTRKRFKAEVVGLRTQFPRIIVKYFATEDDVTAAIALPEMKTAYLHMGDVEARDW